MPADSVWNRVKVIDDGRGIEWPTSGIASADKARQAFDIACARRDGLPYDVNGVNVGRIETPDEAEARLAAEKDQRGRRKPAAKRKKAPKKAARRRKARIQSAKELRAEIRRLKAQLGEQNGKETERPAETASGSRSATA